VRQSEGRTLRFLANVDPIDVARALSGLNPEETLVVVVSKTFTTAETMLNARTVRKWLVAQLGEWVARISWHGNGISKAGNLHPAARSLV
jgi:glucose-6-phosphate isomerase